MKLQVLVSTMSQSNQSELIEKMNIQTDAIIINQCAVSEEEKKIFFVGESNILWVNSEKRGLSRSRNLAIEYSNGDICLIADDDMIYDTGYEETVINAFNKNPEADIIAFQVEGIEKTFKRYGNASKKVSYIQSLKLASVELAIRTNSIKEKGVKFEELFGAGSKYAMGEENIFLYDCLKKGLKIYYEPIKIADVHLGNSSWFRGFNEKYFFDKGAIFFRMHPKHYIFLMLQFAMRKRAIYKSEISFTEAIRCMLKGKNDFINESKQAQGES